MKVKVIIKERDGNEYELTKDNDWTTITGHGIELKFQAGDLLEAVKALY